MEEKEKRIRALTKLYYSNPKIQEALVKFATDREVVPRYFEFFGKRPDIIQYSNDIMSAVNKGATSFHASEEIWSNVLQLSSEITQEQMSELRKSWDLVIDIDSRYFDLSKEAAKLVIDLIEEYGIKNYGIKFSGSKGLHIIISGKAFPSKFENKLMKDCFPEWPRSVIEFIFNEIKQDFRNRVGRIMSFSEMEKTKNIIRVACKTCNSSALIGNLTVLRCPICNLEIERKDFKNSKRRLRCLNAGCAGVLEVSSNADYYYCNNCKDPSNEKFPISSDKYPEIFEEVRGELADEYSEFDLVLVAPRHLFRMPYSLHEKTSLASVVIKKENIDSFTPRDADPMKVKILDFYPQNYEGEAKKLLSAALEWKRMQDKSEEEKMNKKYSRTERNEKRKFSYEEINYKNISEEMFPLPIVKLLKGLKDGKKRGLFILLTFFRSLNFPIDIVNSRIREWNKLNDPPLKEGYIKSQIEWLFRQKKKIMPPNYDNKSFYSDIGLLMDKKPDAKNPIVEVLWALRRKERN
ncbi:MAG: hypothetical protein AABW75_02340 [Nanoarchaeota archaeon]